MSTAEQHPVRIGELSRRVGVSTELLRAWERRYGLLRPERSAGGFRLYSADDERRVRVMQGHLERGLSAAEAAQLTLSERSQVGAWEDDAHELAASLEAFDEQRAHLALDRLLATVTIETLVSEVVVPFLHELGEGWARGEVTVGQEHFASNVIRGRLLGLARGWGRGAGPSALLACPPGELHDLPLIAFGVSLHGRGWRIAFLGADTPVETVAEAAAQLSPELVVLSAVDSARFADVADELAALASEHRLVLAGTGATEEIADRAGGTVVASDPVAAAEELARPAART